MWMVELNIVGRRFVHYVPTRRRIPFRPRAFSWRLT